MYTSQITNNSEFYQDYQSLEEPYVIFRIKENPELNNKIWEGYISDIFDNPPKSVDESRQKNGGWIGMTKDWQELTGPFDQESDEFATVNRSTYLEDLLEYAGANFDLERSSEALGLILDFFKFASEQNLAVELYYGH